MKEGFFQVFCFNKFVTNVMSSGIKFEKALWVYWLLTHDRGLCHVSRVAQVAEESLPLRHVREERIQATEENSLKMKHDVAKTKYILGD